MLKILADENIALVREVFAPLGSLQTMPGRAISAAAVRDCDVLLVRSVTRVDADLLGGSRCRFVGTATSGTDHVDQAWLQQQGIHFADAHGCNAEGVVDYVLAALAWLALRDERNWLQCSVGIVGCGAVGSRLAQRLLALGLQVHIHDPFLAASQGEQHPLAAYFTGLQEALQQDVVSLHVPLTRGGPWPTWHLLNTATLAWLRPDAVLVNAARGSVLDTRALLQWRAQRPGLRLIIDAWEGEPLVDQQLLQQVDLGTPHIAGYSRLGKLRGTWLLQAALCRYLGLSPPPLPPPPAGVEIEPLAPAAAGGAAAALWQLLARCILAGYDPTRDHAALQASVGLPATAAAQHFDRLRKDYPERREFSECSIAARHCGDGKGSREMLPQALRACGFSV